MVRANTHCLNRVVFEENDHGPVKDAVCKRDAQQDVLCSSFVFGCCWTIDVEVSRIEEGEDSG